MEELFSDIVDSFLEWFICWTEVVCWNRFTIISYDGIPPFTKLKYIAPFYGQGCPFFGELWCMCGLLRCFENWPFKLFSVFLIISRRLVWCDRGLFHFNSIHIFYVISLYVCNIVCNVCFNFLFSLSILVPTLLLTLIVSRRYSKDVLSEKFFCVSISFE